ncbi:MAG: glycosyltransferase family protein [Proteobacteria bacterium]|nr:glycosyltransferase family protein [Pseudomonadota bacterium]
MSAQDIKQVSGIIVQARMGSTRLPGKVMMELIDGKSVLGYLLDRLSACKYAHKIIVATTINPQDDILEQWLQDNGYLYYRGSEADCLDRFYQASRKFNLDVIVRITSDCPLIDPQIVDDMISYYIANKDYIDYLSNRQHTNFPEGMDIEILSYKILHEAAQFASLQREKEHINYYFLQRDDQYRIRYYNHGLGMDYSRFKLSIDTRSDLDYIRTLFHDWSLPFGFNLKQLIEKLNCTFGENIDN